MNCPSGGSCQGNQCCPDGHSAHRVDFFAVSFFLGGGLEVSSLLHSQAGNMMRRDLFVCFVVFFLGRFLDI